MPSDRPVWHRRDDESELGFARFQIFLNQLPPRSLAAVAAAEGSPDAKAVREQARRWHWRERVLAFDNWVQAQSDAALAATADEVAREHARILGDLRAIIAHQVERLAEEVKAGDVRIIGHKVLIQALEAEVKLSRLVVGEATERTEVANGTDYSRLSPEELLELARLERKARSAGPVLALVKDN